MTEKLNGAELRFREIEAALSDGEVVSDIERYTKLMKEYRALLPLIEKFRAYKKPKTTSRVRKPCSTKAIPKCAKWRRRSFVAARKGSPCLRRS